MVTGFGSVVPISLESPMAGPEFIPFLSTTLLMSVRLLHRALALGFLLALPLSGPIAAPASAQTIELPPAEAPDPAADLTEPTEPEAAEPTRPLEADTSLLSLEGADRLVQEATAAVDVQDYNLAMEKLSSARRIYNQLSNFYQQLSASFQGIDLRISDGHRSLALETAQKRDEATFQLALVHRVSGEPELAVPLLIQIVRSQNPTTPLGGKAYGQLFELGFVETQFPRNAPAATEN